MDDNIQTTGTSPKPMMRKPDNHMVLAILTTICCCLPLGIVGIVKASKVNDYYYMQQYQMAQQAADDAKKYSLIGVGVGLAIEIIYIIIYGAALFATLGFNS